MQTLKQHDPYADWIVVYADEVLRLREDMQYTKGWRKIPPKQAKGGNLVSDE